MNALGLDGVQTLGSGLSRPECVQCTSDGDVFVSDWRGGVTRICTDGTQQLIVGLHGAGPRPVKTNGFAILPDRSFLLAHLDDIDGGVWRLTLEGKQTPFLLEAEGKPLPPTNFVHADPRGRVWVTVSTRMRPRTLARRPDHADGFIVLVDGGKARIVADALGFTNEAKVDPSGRWLYVNETFGRRLTRFRIAGNGDLSGREAYVEFGAGVFPDGLDFDAEGGVWITSIFSNRLIRVAPDRTQTVVVEDNDPAFVARVDAMLASGQLASATLQDTPAQRLRNLSSSAFGGADLRTLYLGCLQDSRIYRMRSPVAGAMPPHWEVRFD
jgi:sugar lactone lactonase YvrE